MKKIRADAKPPSCSSYLKAGSGWSATPEKKSKRSVKKTSICGRTTGSSTDRSYYMNRNMSFSIISRLPMENSQTRYSSQIDVVSNTDVKSQSKLIQQEEVSNKSKERLGEELLSKSQLLSKITSLKSDNKILYDLYKDKERTLSSKLKNCK